LPNLRTPRWGGLSNEQASTASSKTGRQNIQCRERGTAEAGVPLGSVGFGPGGGVGVDLQAVREGRVKPYLGLNRSAHHVATVAGVRDRASTGGFAVSRLYGVTSERVLVRLRPFYPQKMRSACWSR